MRIIERRSQLLDLRRGYDPRRTLGLVPTMGALHDGHLKLVEQARQECDDVAVSIFVNPTQFDQAEDLENYPRERQADLERLSASGVDWVWFGRVDEVYPPGFATRVSVPELARHLCGGSRPGHFDGVALVVLKLLQLFRPRRAYFGRKDYQQLKIIERMVRDLNVEVDVVACDTVRDEFGLALSSRNQRLSPLGLQSARKLNRSLIRASQLFHTGERRSAELLRAASQVLVAEPGIQLDYLELVDAESLKALTVATDDSVIALAARVEGVRLIDNRRLADSYDEVARP